MARPARSGSRSYKDAGFLIHFSSSEYDAVIVSLGYLTINKCNQYIYNQFRFLQITCINKVRFF